MEMTKSLCCRRLCFTNASSCPHCGKGFQPGSLAAKAVAENKVFDRKTYAIFLAAFLILPPALFLIQGYLHGSL
jgi:hypothetical protein